MSLTQRVQAWRDAGAFERFRDREIFVRIAGPPPPEPAKRRRLRRVAALPKAPLVLFLHGFPSSSYDWEPLLKCGLGGHEALVFDFLGFGLSDKPADHEYSLLWQADLATELVARHGDGRPVVVVAHDMGTSVANELMARDLEGRLPFELAGVLLLNGSMIQDAASPTLGQKLLRSRVGPLASRLSGERFFRHQFGSIFSKEHPLSQAEAADQWSLLTHKGGIRIGHLTIGYMDERMREAGRWHGAIRDWPGRLGMAWAMADPVATPNVLRILRELRPAAPVTEWKDLGHYPQIEAPGRVAGEIRRFLAS